MRRSALVVLQVAISCLILGGMVSSCLSHRSPDVPAWSISDETPQEADAKQAILDYLHSQEWARGDSFDIRHVSRLKSDFDRFGANPNEPAMVMALEYLRRISDPHELSAPSRPQQFVFVLDEQGKVIRRLAIDRRHKPYADLFDFE